MDGRQGTSGNGDATIDIDSETEPLTVNVNTSPSFSDDLSPKTPAERVRFILAEDKEKALEDDTIQLAVHAPFCQMDVLCHFEEGGTGWKESIRWLKYEEKVEAGDRWSKPHVSTTSLHALYDIKKGIEENTVILDLPSPHGCLHQVAENITSAVCKDKGWGEDMKSQMLDIMLRPHKHKHRKGGKHGQPNSKSEAHREGSESPPEAPGSPDVSTTESKNNTLNSSKMSKLSSLKPQLKRLPSSKETSSLHHTYPGGILPDNLLPYKPNKRLMKKIPGGSEAANILIGQVDFLDEPIMAFARLSKASILADLTEVALPTRFVFLVLGPPETTSLFEYEEVGRAMACLLTDRVFCEVAYKATARQDLMDGIDEFIDDLTVLPPSIWDPTTRLEPPEKTISIEKIRARLMDSARHAADDAAYHFAESAEGDETLKRTGRLFGGLVADVKRRYSQYWSDIVDGFHLQCLASIIFLYFACITPIITFGGLLGSATNGYMGTMETILAGAICGLIYHLFAGQPLTIVGATGPMLVFESILFTVCEDNNLHFLSFRFWIGTWVAVILIIIVAFDLSALVQYITRFTEESFAVLISLIFVFESFAKIGQIWNTHPIHMHTADEDTQFKCHCVNPPIMNGTAANATGVNITETFLGNMNDSNPMSYAHDERNSEAMSHQIWEYLSWSKLVYEDCITYQHRIVVGTGCITEETCLEHGWLLDGPACNLHSVTHSVPDVFFLCCFLYIGTFGIAMFFRTFRGSNYFPSIVRSTLADFAVLIAIVICTSVDFTLSLETPKLKVPSEFKNTRDDRGWMVNPMGVTYWWLIIAALVPALLATILIFLDQQITSVIVNRKEHKLQKSHGYHLDVMVLSILIFLCSLVGLPWFVAATVRSVTHVRSLIRESELRAPGERPQFLGVREQRVTGVAIHMLIAVSILLTSLLQHIPMAVLYGVFLYMGVTSLSGVQFVQRILLLLQPSKYQEDYIFLRHVHTYRTHIFTAIQIVCMSVMWFFKSVKKIAIFFPLMILALCFIRKGLDYFFTQSELFWLDHILPDEHRRRKEDEQKLKEAMEDQTDDEDSTHKPTEDETGFYQMNMQLTSELEVPLTSNSHWHQLIAKRDYGVGRNVRPRKLSKAVVNRYNQAHKPDEAGGDASNSENEDDSIHHPLHSPVPFRERKFSY